MYKQHSNAYAKVILRDVVLLSLAHITSLQEQLRKLDITDVNYKDKTIQEKFVCQTAINCMAMLVDVIHPTFEIWQNLLDTDPNSELLKHMRHVLHMAREEKRINGECLCQTCKKGVKDV